MLAVEHLRLRQPGSLWLIPVRFDDCEIPDLEIGSGLTLRSIQCADLFGDREEYQAGLLIRQIQDVLDGYKSQVTDAGITVKPPTGKIRSSVPAEPAGGLLGRDAELEDLAQFCVGQGTSSYQWWQAAPWAGKSALPDLSLAANVCLPSRKPGSFARDASELAKCPSGGIIFVLPQRGFPQLGF
jgi:hypothetical protein